MKNPTQAAADIIPPFEYDSPRIILDPAEANVLVRFLNRLRRLRVAEGETNEFFFSDHDVVLQLKKSITQPGDQLTYYRGEYAANKATTFMSGQEFKIGHMVRVSPSNPESTTGAGGTVPGVYVCAQDGPTETDKPKHPLQSGGENAYWNWLSTWPYQTVVCDAEGNETDFLVDGQEDPD